MNRQEAKLEYDSEAYYDLLDLIVETYSPGELITHEWVKSKLMFKELDPKEFESLNDFLKAIELQQFEYMYLIDKIRWDLLEKHKKYIKNIRGEGYQILPPKDHVNYAYTKALKEIKKSLSQSFLMMDNVSLPYHDMELQQENTANRVKLSMLKTLMRK